MLLVSPIRGWGRGARDSRSVNLGKSSTHKYDPFSFSSPLDPAAWVILSDTSQMVSLLSTMPPSHSGWKAKSLRMASTALPELTPPLSILMSLPTLSLQCHFCSLHYSHMGLLAVPWMCHIAVTSRPLRWLFPPRCPRGSPPHLLLPMSSKMLKMSEPRHILRHVWLMLHLFWYRYTLRHTLIPQNLHKIEKLGTWTTAESKHWWIFRKIQLSKSALPVRDFHPGRINWAVQLICFMFSRFCLYTRKCEFHAFFLVISGFKDYST